MRNSLILLPLAALLVVYSVRYQADAAPAGKELFLSLLVLLVSVDALILVGLVSLRSLRLLLLSVSLI